MKYSTMAIVQAAADVKQQISGLDNRRLYYEIQALNPQISSSFSVYFKGSNAQGPCAKQFGEQLDTLLGNDNIALIRVSARDSRGKTLLTSDIKIKPQFADAPVYAQPQPQQQPDSSRCVAVPQPVPAQPAQAAQATMAPRLDIRGLLGLLGVDTASLDGLDNDPTGGLGAVLAYRDRAIEKKFEDRERERNYERLLDECRELKAEIRRLTDDTAAKSKEISQLRADIEDYEDQIAELEKLKPENSVAGVAISGLLASAGQALLRRNAGLLGRLLGVDRDSMLGMLDADTDAPDAPAAQAPAALPSVEVEPEDERTPDIDSVHSWLRNIPDDDFARVLDILRLFAAQKETIKALHKHLFDAPQQQELELEN